MLFLSFPSYATDGSQSGAQNPKFELRERYERRIDRDFSKSHHDNESDLFSRFRILLSSKNSQNQSVDLVLQHGEQKAWIASNSHPDTTSRTDVLVARLTLPAYGGVAALGRQQLRKGTGRLLGESEWGTTGQAFDMVRFTKGRADFFVGKLGLASTPNHTSQLIFASYAGQLGETTLFQSHNTPGNPSSDLWTLHHLYHRDSGSLSWDIEGALQSGDVAGNDQSAWAFSARAKRKVSRQTTAQLDVNAASGGADKKRPHTFDQLFPTNHGRYGEMDVQGYRNMKGFSLTFSQQAANDLTIGFGVHRYWLMDDRDAWYGANGRANKSSSGKFVDPTGLAGNDLGSEFDLYAEKKASRDLTVRAGISTLAPGRFVKSLSGDNTNQTYGYLQAITKF